jgi:hypothetical protein
MLHAGFLLGSLFDPEDGGEFPSKRWLTFKGLHGVISQKIVLFTNYERNSKIIHQ